jgi:SAM-dependent methyltransferase
MKKDIKDIFKNKAVTRLDLGCGENKQPGCIGVDFRNLPGVDIVQDLTLFPWQNVPSQCANVVYSSHLLEHINPASSDPRLAGLVDLLLDKRLVTKKEIDAYVGDYRFLGGFVRFMDEVWRTLKPGGQFISTFPYAGSPGYWWDPTHLCPIRHETLYYFDPLAKDGAGNLVNFYTIYRPKPWKVIKCFYSQGGNMEICLEKRLIDPSYKVSKDNGMSIM